MHDLPRHGVEPLGAFLADGPFRAEVERAGVPTLYLGDAPRVRSVAHLRAAVRALAATAGEHHVDVLEGCGEKMSLVAGGAARATPVGCGYNLQDAPAPSPPPTAVEPGAAAGPHDPAL